MPGVNVTIDDTHGDSVTGALPVYSPVNAWKDGTNCSECSVKPDPTLARQGSWRDTTQVANDTTPHSVTLAFNGTAAYVYCILDDKKTSFVTRTDLLFSIDGQRVGSFVHEPSNRTSGNGLMYDVPVYVNTSLPSGSHTLVISTNGSANSSLLLFDYMTYTQDPNVTSAGPSSSSPTASASLSKTSKVPVLPIVLGITLGLVFLLLSAFLFLCCRRRRMNRNQHIPSNSGTEAPPPKPTRSFPKLYVPAPSVQVHSPRFVVTTATPISSRPGTGQTRLLRSSHSAEESDVITGLTPARSPKSSPGRAESILSDATTASFYPASHMFGTTPPEDTPLSVPRISHPYALHPGAGVTANGSIRVQKGTYEPNTRSFR